MGMAQTVLAQVISIVVVCILFGTLLLAKKKHYIIAGLFLISLGVLPLLFDFGISSFDITAYPVYGYAAVFLIIFAGKDLFTQAFKEKESKLKWPSFGLAIFLLASVVIPELHGAGVVDFVLEYPPLVDYALYITGGVFLIVGSFTLLRT